MPRRVRHTAASPLEEDCQRGRDRRASVNQGPHRVWRSVAGAWSLDRRGACHVEHHPAAVPTRLDDAGATGGGLLPNGGYRAEIVTGSVSGSRRWMSTLCYLDLES